MQQKRYINSIQAPTIDERQHDDEAARVYAQPRLRACVCVCRTCVRVSACPRVRELIPHTRPDVGTRASARAATRYGAKSTHARRCPCGATRWTASLLCPVLYMSVRPERLEHCDRALLHSGRHYTRYAFTHTHSHIRTRTSPRIKSKQYHGAIYPLSELCMQHDSRRARASILFAYMHL